MDKSILRIVYCSELNLGSVSSICWIPRLLNEAIAFNSSGCDGA